MSASAISHIYKQSSLNMKYSLLSLIVIFLIYIINYVIRDIKSCKTKTSQVDIMPTTSNFRSMTLSQKCIQECIL